MYTRTWRRAGPLRQQRFFDILANQDKDGAFDEAFIELVHKRRSSASQLTFKLISLQVPIFVLLVFSLIPIQASVSILGITPAASRNLREVLVVVSATLGVVSSGLGIYYAVLTEIIAAYVEKRSKGDKEVREFLGIGHGVDFIVMPNVEYKNLSLGWGFAVFLVVVFLAGVVFVLSIAAAALYLHYVVLKDIYYDPSFSDRVSMYVIAFVLLGDFLSISINALSGWPIAMKDYTNMMALDRLKQKEPEKVAEVYRQMAAKHVRRPWLLRHLTRMKMPRHLPLNTNPAAPSAPASSPPPSPST